MGTVWGGLGLDFCVLARSFFHWVWGGNGETVVIVFVVVLWGWGKDDTLFFGRDPRRWVRWKSTSF